jgi:nucleoside diphosphate kinase
MQGRENASIIDLKMGTNTITFNINKPDRLKKRLLKDQMTTSKKLGLKVIGYVIKSRQKDIEEKFYKWPYKT